MLGARTFPILLAIANSALAAPETEVAPPPADLTRLKLAFQQNAERAVQPLRERYISELKRLLEQYTRAGKLTEALAVKGELDSISAGTALATDTVAEFERKLIGTEWTWNGTFHIIFGPEGKASRGHLEDGEAVRRRISDPRMTTEAALSSNAG